MNQALRSMKITTRKWSLAFMLLLLLGVILQVRADEAAAEATTAEATASAAETTAATASEATSKSATSEGGGASPEARTAAGAASSAAGGGTSPVPDATTTGGHVTSKAGPSRPSSSEDSDFLRKTKFSFAVLIHKPKVPFNEYACLGVLLGPGYVLTGAHCFTGDTNVSHYRVMFSEDYVFHRQAKPGHIRNIASITVANKWSDPNLAKPDLALVELVKQVIPSSNLLIGYVTPPETPYSEEEYNPPLNCKHIRWIQSDAGDVTGDGDYALTTLTVHVTAMNRHDCKKQGIKTKQGDLRQGVFCIRNTGNAYDSCYGMAGSTLVCSSQIVGMVAGADPQGCANDGQGSDAVAFTDIGAYSGWLRQIIANQIRADLVARNATSKPSKTSGTLGPPPAPADATDDGARGGRPYNKSMSEEVFQLNRRKKVAERANGDESGEATSMTEGTTVWKKKKNGAGRGGATSWIVTGLALLPVAKIPV